MEQSIPASSTPEIQLAPLTNKTLVELCRREADTHLKETKKADKTVKKLNVKLKHYEDHKQHIEAYTEISSVQQLFCPNLCF